MHLLPSKISVVPPRRFATIVADCIFTVQSRDPLSQIRRHARLLHLLSTLCLLRREQQLTFVRTLGVGVRLAVFPHVLVQMHLLPSKISVVPPRRFATIVADCIFTVQSRDPLSQIRRHARLLHLLSTLCLLRREQQLTFVRTLGVGVRLAVFPHVLVQVNFT
ncbi:hypothetical protein DEO72_LG7g1124 [Vigna unguiculata]|uniref:Uncharacterized protein n=1 Tax=Vigna unguiculata TaxID=3917 RepID=A0A4D6MHY0_VIGUN|nr:hypothetical protein DEO72_LG7g1124 [Vigna unguiculata]